MTSKINVRRIIVCHISTLKSGNNKFSRQDLWIFVIVPLGISTLLTLFLGTLNNQLTSLYSVSLAIFIGLFLNLLVLIITFSNSANTADKKNRQELIKQTFYNISFTIVISIIALISLSILNLDIMLSTASQDMFNFKFWHGVSTGMNLLFIFKSALILIFYFLMTQIVVTLLMVVKRIFSLFEHEIDPQIRR